MTNLVPVVLNNKKPVLLILGQLWSRGKAPGVSYHSCNEVANFVGSRSLIAECKYNLLVNHFKPGADYSFPKCSSRRAFQYRWLMNFPWLAYSKQENGGFCLPCVLFASPEYHGSYPGILVSRPLITFTKAL